MDGQEVSEGPAPVVVDQFRCSDGASGTDPYDKFILEASGFQMVVLSSTVIF